MANDQLVQYIKTVEAQGFKEDVIRDALIKNKWQQADIDAAFAFIKQPSSVLAASAPMAPQTHVSDIPGVTITENPVNPAVSASSEAHHIVNYNSPFSVGIAIILFGSLMILVNKIIDDSALYSATVNSKLIFDSVLVLPFLLIAFLLHGSFENSDKRFLILSQPYFIVAAFLVLRLLWDTSAYILDANATYGVYVVLILVIAVLTGIILFVQKYIKN